MANQEIVNPFILLQNHDYYKKILRYNKETGEYKELDRDDNLLASQLRLGFYVRISDQFIGVFASNEGPVLFYNDKKVNLKDRSVKLMITALDNGNNATIIENGNLIYSIIYPKVTSLGVHEYADEEFMDFFKWLEGSLSSEEFYNFYTM